MSESLADKLKTEVEECDWSMLDKHLEKEAVIIASPEIDLLSVGLALAQDDAESVKAWQGSNALRKPNKDDIDAWKKDPYKKFAKFIIIQPFVIIQVI